MNLGVVVFVAVCQKLSRAVVGSLYVALSVIPESWVGKTDSRAFQTADNVNRVSCAENIYVVEFVVILVVLNNISTGDL